MTPCDLTSYLFQYFNNKKLYYWRICLRIRSLNQFCVCFKNTFSSLTENQTKLNKNNNVSTPKIVDFFINRNEPPPSAAVKFF